MEFWSTYETYKSEIEAALDALAQVPDSPQRSVCEAMRYSLMVGGKRIRPVLTLAVTQLLGGNVKAAVRVGCAIECIHTYSLIHDDLPCMDNDDLRRGKPTCHRAFEENIALLAGDGLLTRAFELLSAHSEEAEIDPMLQIQLIRLISSAAGCDGMIGGQVVDLECEKSSAADLDMLTYMHERKTGALIRVSALAGCILAGVTEEEDQKYRKINEFSSILGLAFQIKDDILDVTGDENELGKPVGSDAQQQKTTFVTLMGMEAAEKRLRELTRQAVKALECFGGRADFLTGLAQYLLERNQ